MNTFFEHRIKKNYQTTVNSLPFLSKKLFLLEYKNVIFGLKLPVKNKHKAMLVDNFIEMLKDLFSSEQKQTPTEIDSIVIFNEIRKDLEDYLLEQSEDVNSTDGVFEFLSSLSEKIQEEFNKLLGEDNDKRFIKELAKVLALLLNRKFNTAEKIKKILKVAIETTINIWSRQRQQ